MAITICGNKNTRALMLSDFFVKGKMVFYVRPYSEDTKSELQRLLKEVSVEKQQTEIAEKNGTYRVRFVGDAEGFDFATSFWGILFRRFMAEAKAVCIDPVTEEKYYGAIFSNEYINPQPRRLVA